MDPLPPGDRAQQPRLDRRTLERLIIGAPARATSPPVGDEPAAPTGPQTPQRAAPASPGRLLLLLAGPRARRSGWAAHAAADYAAGAARDAQLVLVDVDVESPSLHRVLGAPNDEGLSDALLFGTSLRRAALPVEGRPFRLLPAGPAAPGLETIAAHPRWPELVAEAGRRGLVLLAYAPAEADVLRHLAPLAERAVLLAAPGEAASLRGLVPSGLPLDVVTAPEPPPEPPPSPELAPVGAAPDSGPGRELGPQPEMSLARWLRTEEAVAEAIPAVAYAPSPTRSALPPTSPLRERVTRVGAVLVLLYWTYYIVWRWAATLNPDALWFSIPLALAETWGLLSAFFLVFISWRLVQREPPPAPPGLSVDVLVTAYDEPLEVIRRTALGARGIRYPHRTFVLDDGRRDEVQAMAAELGVGYITRADHEHAKAGNLNHALRHTSGDLLLQLDAGHAPLPQILDRLLGYFDDPKVAFVQTPQDYYHTDSFTPGVSEEDRRTWEDRKLFFAAVQPGMENWNSAFFSGSCAVLRRAALDEIGGFSTETIAADIETSLRIHARGWRSVYHAESLAYGLATSSADAFHTRHLRWARGGMQVLRKFNPLTYPGLTLAQRIGYLSSLSASLRGAQKLVYYSAPLVFFLTGVLPIRALNEEFLARVVPYLLLASLLVGLVSRGTGSAWAAERYQMAKFWTYTRALPAFFSNRRFAGRVTPEERAEVPFVTYAPHLVLMALTVFAVNWATLAYEYGWVNYRVPGWRSLAFQLNFLWALINFTLAATVVRLSVGIQHRRQHRRFTDRFPIEVRRRGDSAHLPDRIVALTEDLSSSGLSFRASRPLEAHAEVEICLPLSTGPVSVNGRVVHRRAERSADVPVFVHGIAFQDVPLDVRDAIELHCTHLAVSNRPMQYQSTGAFFSRAREWARQARGGRPQRIRLPTWVRLANGDPAGQPREDLAFLEEISPGGARLVMNEPVPPGTRMTFEVPGTELYGRGFAVFSRALETPIGVRFAVGMRRERRTDPPTPTRRREQNPRPWNAAGASASTILGRSTTATAPATTTRTLSTDLSS